MSRQISKARTEKIVYMMPNVHSHLENPLIPTIDHYSHGTIVECVNIARVGSQVVFDRWMCFAHDKDWSIYVNNNNIHHSGIYVNSLQLLPWKVLTLSTLTLLIIVGIVQCQN